MKCKMCGHCCAEPGWLEPEDWDNMAKKLGLSKTEVLNKYLVIDYLANETGYHYVLAPLKVLDGKPLSPPGQRVSWHYANLSGICIFLKDKLCLLHPEKPRECRDYQCDNSLLKNTSPNSYVKEVLKASQREELVKLWESVDLKKYVDQRYDKLHCLKNLALEQRLLKELKKDFPDPQKILELENRLE